MIVGECIKIERQKKGLTLEELSEISGVSIVSIMRYENGMIKNPQIKNVVKIARSLNIPIAVLVDMNA